MLRRKCGARHKTAMDQKATSAGDRTTSDWPPPRHFEFDSRCGEFLYSDRRRI